MESERAIFLEKETNNKANGFYPRSLTTGSFKLNLQVPRDRKSKFRPHILPDPYKRTDKNYIDLIMSLVVNGYSESQLWASLKELGLPYSQDELNKIKDQLIEKLNDFKQRELKDVAFALFIDGYPTEVKEKGKVRKACVYIVLGIDLEGKKDVYGFYTFFGDENRADWLRVFNDLIERGLKKVALVVSDDFPGIESAINALFPKADHQLCYVHLQRNVRKNMGKGDAKFFNAELKRIKDCKDYEEGRERFENLCEQFKSKYPTFIKYVNGKIEKYLCFLKYPEEIKKHIYTTNGVESLNSLLKKIRARLGGYFQSIAILEINILLQIENLKENKWKKGIPAFKAKAYEINQIFNLKFYYEKETQNY
jgi:transposase-like protein